MVYATPGDLGWKPYVESWMSRFIENPETRCLNDEAVKLLKEMFNMFCDIAFGKLRELVEYEPMPCVEIQTITNLCNFLEYFLTNAHGKFTVKDSIEKIAKKLEASFAFSFIWSFGASHNINAYKYLDNLFRDCFAKCSIPMNDTVFEYYMDFNTSKFIPWSGSVPSFDYELGSPYFSILVPTIDTCRYSYLLDILLWVQKHVFFTGETGVGKSVVMQKYIADFKDKRKIYPNFINFSAQTNSFES
jgi:dynein heavy chain